VFHILLCSDIIAIYQYVYNSSSCQSMVHIYLQTYKPSYLDSTIVTMVNGYSLVN